MGATSTGQDIVAFGDSGGPCYQNGQPVALVWGGELECTDRSSYERCQQTVTKIPFAWFGAVTSRTTYLRETLNKRPTAAWQPLTPVNGWTLTSYYTDHPMVALVNGTVHLRGGLMNGTAAKLFTLPPGYRVFAVNPASTGQTSLQTLFNTTSLPTNTSFHGVIKSSIPLVVQGGFVGNRSQFFLFQNASGTGTVLGQGHMGNMSAYPGVVYVANTGSISTSASLDFYNDTGQIAATTQSTLIPAHGRIKLSLGSLLDPSGNAITIADYYSMRVRGSESSAPLGGWAATIVPVGSTATVSVAPLQVVE